MEDLPLEGLASEACVRSGETEGSGSYTGRTGDDMEDKTLISRDDGAMEAQADASNPSPCPSPSSDTLSMMVPASSCTTPFAIPCRRHLRRFQGRGFSEYRNLPVGSPPSDGSGPDSSPESSPELCRRLSESPPYNLDPESALASLNANLSLACDEDTAEGEINPARTNLEPTPSTSSSNDNQDSNDGGDPKNSGKSDHQKVLQYKSCQAANCSGHPALMMHTKGSPPEPISMFTFNHYMREHHEATEMEWIRRQIVDAGTACSLNAALKLAVLCGHTEYVIYLLQNHLEEAFAQHVCCPLIILAVRLNHVRITEALCRYASTLKRTEYYINSQGCSALECGRTALHLAAEMDSTTIIQILILYGADHKAEDDLKMTPLERLLARRSASQLTYNVLRSAWELIRCLPVLPQKISRDWHKLLSRNAAWSQRAPAEWHTLEPGPFTLMHQARCAIREQLGPGGLPHHTHKLGLPLSLSDYLNMRS